VGKVTGFKEYRRQSAKKSDPQERIKHYREFELPVIQEDLRVQGARCMDCGVPFCNTGCPLGNLIPDWNDATYHGEWQEAIDALQATNNFPEFTGRVCPAPCEASCVLNINDDPVSIKLIEKSIADRAFADGLIKPQPPKVKTGKKVAVIGSGPAGMAAAQQLARAGHAVTVFERDDRIGGLLTYGIPDFKLEKTLVQRRVEQMQAEGVEFRTSVNVGQDVTGDELRRQFDAVCLCIGSRVPRDLPVPGRELEGIHFAMEFLEQQNRRVAGDVIPDGESILATNKHVVVIGGGDTGSDCIGTSHRQGAASVTNLEIMPQPPDSPAAHTPWPLWPLMLRTSTSHEEGGERRFSVTTQRAEGENGHVKRLVCTEVRLEGGKLQPVPGTEFTLQADLVLLAMGFVHPEKPGLVEQLGVEINERGNVRVNDRFETSVAGVYAAGDGQRGQSLVVWAISDGRKAAREIDTFLMGNSDLDTGRVAGIIR
jgi:glutamate synthase (NADPH/NADH) small chain